DQFGNVAWWDPVSQKVLATGTLPGEVEITLPKPMMTDMAVGYDGVLYMATDGRVIMEDLRNRWDAVVLEEKDFVAWRLAADPKGGVWVLDRINRRLARLQGLPFPTRPYGPYTSQVFRPCIENPNPPRLRVLPETKAIDKERAVALCCSPKGRLALLCWQGMHGDAQVHFLDENEQIGPATKLNGVSFPFSMAWVTEERLAVLFDNGPGDGSKVKEAAVYSIPEKALEVSPVGDIYPLKDHTGGPFLHG